MKRIFSEILQVCTNTTVKDSAGGNKQDAEVVIETVKVTITEKPLNRSDESGKLIFHKVLSFEMWVNPAYTLTTSHYFKFGEKVLKIHSLELSKDNRKIYVITEGIF